MDPETRGSWSAWYPERSLDGLDTWRFSSSGLGSHRQDQTISIPDPRTAGYKKTCTIKIQHNYIDSNVREMGTPKALEILTSEARLRINEWPRFSSSPFNE